MKRRLKKVFTIFVEGRSEEIYFNSLKQQDLVRKSDYKLMIINCEGLDKLLDIALNSKYQKQMRDSVKIAFVFDKDHLTREKFDQMRPKYLIGFSNPQFELWLLAHFVKLKASYSDLILELNKYLPDYQKNSFKIADLASDYQKAIENSLAFNLLSFDELGTSIPRLFAEISLS